MSDLTLRTHTSLRGETMVELHGTHGRGLTLPRVDRFTTLQIPLVPMEVSTSLKPTLIFGLKVIIVSKAGVSFSDTKRGKLFETRLALDQWAAELLLLPPHRGVNTHLFSPSQGHPQNQEQSAPSWFERTQTDTPKMEFKMDHFPHNAIVVDVLTPARR